jgi:hypothetical protein
VRLRSSCAHELTVGGGNRDIPWKERAEIASEVAETEMAVHSATVIDARSVLIDKRSKKIQLTGFRIKDESNESDTSADFGRFLVGALANPNANRDSARTCM